MPLWTITLQIVLRDFHLKCTEISISPPIINCTYKRSKYFSLLTNFLKSPLCCKTGIKWFFKQ